MQVRTAVVRTRRAGMAKQPAPWGGLRVAGLAQRAQERCRRDSRHAEGEAVAFGRVPDQDCVLPACHLDALTPVGAAVSGLPPVAYAVHRWCASPRITLVSPVLTAAPRTASTIAA